MYGVWSNNPTPAGPGEQSTGQETCSVTEVERERDSEPSSKRAEKKNKSYVLIWLGFGRELIMYLIQ